MSLSDMMGRSRHSVQQAMERTRKNIAHHRRRFKLNCTAWICCVFILNASTGSSAQTRQCTEVRPFLLMFFAQLTCVRTLRFVQCIPVFFKAFVVVWHTFICTFAVSLLAAYVQQDVLAYHTLL